MSLVLQTLGVVFLFLLLAVVVVILVILAKLRKFARKIEGMAKSAAASAAPARLHLRPMAAPSWDDGEAVEAQAEPLPDLGFTEGGTYQVEEVPGLGLQAWFHPAEAVTAIIYEHPVAGVWTDMVTRYEDGTRATFVNTVQGGGVDHAPGHTVERFDGIGSRELFQTFLARRPDRPKVTPSAAEFPAVFEKAYADEMDWRNARGGATLEEIREIARRTGKPYDEDIIQATRQFAEVQALAQLDETLRETFLAETSMPAAEWERLRGRVVLVHDRMNEGLLQAALSRCLGAGGEDHEEEVGAALVEGAPGRSPRQVFAEFNAGRPEAERCRKLGEVRHPIEADVYAAPTEES